MRSFEMLLVVELLHSGEVVFWGLVLLSQGYEIYEGLEGPSGCSTGLREGRCLLRLRKAEIC